jgi:hypothetical protein
VKTGEFLKMYAVSENAASCTPPTTPATPGRPGSTRQAEDAGSVHRVRNPRHVAGEAIRPSWRWETVLQSSSGAERSAVPTAVPREE